MKLWPKLLVGASVCALMGGCPAPNANNGDTAGTNGDVSDVALNFGGTANGTVGTTSSTATSTTVQSGRKVTGRSLTAGTVGWFEDLEGNRLRDAKGNTYPEFQVGTDGTFGPIAGLPVGVDIRLVCDENGDGKPELIAIVNIPKNPSGDTGSLDDATCDPLSTLIYAKLYKLLADRGIEPHKIGFSPSGLIGRIRDAFEHLFEESGIEQTITIDDVANLSDEQLAALFDQIIPEIARRGMDMAAGNIDLANAKDAASVVKAVATILVQGGFAIADDPNGIDLSFLGSLPNVKTISFNEFNHEEGDSAEDAPRPTIYRTNLAGFDRNFAERGEQKGDGGPLFSEHVLSRMAEVYLAGKQITIADLYDVIVDIDAGMGARLTYGKWNGPGQPPTNVFESSDGSGIEINLNQFRTRLAQLGAGDPDSKVFEQRKNQIRNTLREFLANTAEPKFDLLFEGILTDRVPEILEYARQIRDQRAHLPFSRSGPSLVHVVGTADGFRDENAKPATCDLTFSERGEVETVEYNSAGEGKFYLGFGQPTLTGLQVTFIHRGTGRPLHSKEGRLQMRDLSDSDTFGDINGESFFDVFSETTLGFPGAPALRVPNPNFDPTKTDDPESNPKDFTAFVLMTQPGPDGQAVRVNFNTQTGIATFSENGRFYLLFNENTNTQGVFKLIAESGEIVETTPGDHDTQVLIAATAVQGIELSAKQFTNIYGVDVPNPGYDPSGAPFFDDINANGKQDAGEPSFDHRDFLFDVTNWRSTRVDQYYRRGDTGGFFEVREVNFGAETPQLLNGTPLVARNLKPRLNAFRFGNPNLTINLLAAFSPAEFFDGAHALNKDTKVNPFTALALVNLVFGSIHNVEATIDFDGPGPLPAHMELINAELFVAPLGDPLQLMLDGFATRAK